MAKQRDDAPICPRCNGWGHKDGKPCEDCQATGYLGGREP